MLVICGPSCIGKDTMAKILIDLGWSKLVSYTTRPRRENETNSDYIFIKNPEFNQMKDNFEFVDATLYTQNNGEIWQYGIRESHLELALKNPKSFAILNPYGVKRLVDSGIKIDILFLDHDSSPEMLAEIERRYYERGGDESDWTARRMQDIKDFAWFRNWLDDEGLSDKVLRMTIDRTITMEKFSNYVEVIDDLGYELCCAVSKWNSEDGHKFRLIAKRI